MTAANPSYDESACGTETGYMRHYRRGQKACAECLEAHRRYSLWTVRRFRARQRAKQAS